jgi:hypothetical protein
MVFTPRSKVQNRRELGQQAIDVETIVPRLSRSGLPAFAGEVLRVAVAPGDRAVRSVRCLRLERGNPIRTPGKK